MTVLMPFVDRVFQPPCPSYVYYTQIMQAETLASAYRLWRRNWKGKGREYTAGALVWQVCTFVTLYSSYDTSHRHAPHPTPHTLRHTHAIFSVHLRLFSLTSTLMCINLDQRLLAGHVLGHR